MTLQNSHKLLPAILAGITIGLLVGGTIPEWGMSVQFVGDLFLKALFVLVVPLVMSSMIVGVSSLGDVRQLGRLGSLTVGYFLLTTGIAVLIGLLLVISIHPGTQNHQGIAADNVEHVSSSVHEKAMTVGEFLSSMVSRLVPQNLIAAMVETDVLSLIVFSLVFGGVLTTLGDRAQVVLRFFEGANDAIMVMVHLLMWAAPVGIGALIAGRLGNAGGFQGFWPQLETLGAYSLTVVIALMIHGMVILPVLLRIIGKQSPVSLIKNVGTALTTAFSTSSSSATLPLTMEGVIDRHGISPHVARFVIPLGATINMNGTALYEAVAAVFIAQTYGIELGLGQTLVIALTATLAAIGAAGIPEAGLVTMVMVLKAVDLPLEGISLILVIDWLLDRFRTSVNVWGDVVGAAVVERLERA